MSCYGSLAGYYDKLTGDVPYSKFIEFYEAEFARDGGEFRLLLDLCCGTGTLTCELARRGYEMIRRARSRQSSPARRCFCVRTRRSSTCTAP